MKRKNISRFLSENYIMSDHSYLDDANRKRAITLSLFHRAISVLLIVASFSFLGERQYFSQANSFKPRNASLPPQNERAVLSPSEVVKQYWKASTARQFSETWRYIDFCSLKSKYSADRETIKTLTQLTPRSIYEGPEAPDAASVELMIKRITEAKIAQAMNEVIFDDYTYVPTPAMRESLATYYVTEFQIKFQELSEQYVASNDSGTTSGAAAGNIRQRSAADDDRAATNIRAQFIEDFARLKLFGQEIGGVFIAVKGRHGRKRERLSVDYAVKMLDHVWLRAELHA